MAKGAPVLVQSVKAYVNAYKKTGVIYNLLKRHDLTMQTARRAAISSGTSVLHNVPGEELHGASIKMVLLRCKQENGYLKNSRIGTKETSIGTTRLRRIPCD